MDVLEQKATWNLKIAIIAEQEKYYDVAVSRYYYSVLQIVAWLLKKEKVWDYHACTGIHSIIGDQLISFLQNQIGTSKLKKKDYQFIGNWKKLKDEREHADYEDDCLSDKQRYDMFKERVKGLTGFLESNGLIPSLFK